MLKVKQNGFTILELMITIAVMGVVLAFAVPNLQDFFDKRRVIKLAEAIYSDMLYARTEALSAASNLNIADSGGISVMVKRNSATEWFIGTSVNDACDPEVTDLTNASACYVIKDDGDNVVDGVDVNLNGSLDTATEQDLGDRVLRVLRSTDHPGTVMPAFGTDEPFGSNVPAEITFSSTRGTAMDSATRTIESGEINIESDGGYQMRVTVGFLGQVNICSPTGSGNVPGYPDC